MRRLAFVAVACLLFAIPVAQAQDTDFTQRQAAARVIVQLSLSTNRLDQFSNAYQQVLLARFQAQGVTLTDAQKAAIAQITRDELQHVVDSATDDVVSAYADEFTLDELNALKAFYQSAVGQKLLAKQPELVSRFSQEVADDVKADMPGMLAKMKAAMSPPGANLPPTSPAGTPSN